MSSVTKAAEANPYNDKMLHYVSQFISVERFNKPLFISLPIIFNIKLVIRV
ncbi:Uncharacterized protein BM_BM693 [Brugia malayi]|uniref:Bm693 n=1 Tax=Brugia malayi TaxID=6279 RepID=A0A0K0JQ82_BRUMA|nr:Uncharacterized protein BM_BM693 [Brugia malayi]CDQ00715.1 Bm693 [Brugia malayi]VIO86471.1 Uncharacterized protein BM_BM693 [Brugia malayi]